MITRTKLVIGTLAAGLALAACSSVAGTSGQGNNGKPFAQHQVQGNGQKVQWGSSGAADIKDLAAVKRDLQRAAWRTPERALACAVCLAAPGRPCRRTVA